MTKKKLLTKISAGIFALAAPFAMLAALPGISGSSASAAKSEYLQSVTISNGSFDATSSSYLEGDFSGWKRKWGNTGAKTMVIDIAKDYDNYGSSIYYLKENPGQKGSDNKILMINSASSSPNSTNYKPSSKSEGYYSNSIALSANSYYEFQVSMKTATFDEATEFGSIYLSGLKDEKGNVVTLSYENVTSRNWSTYYFYVATGNTSQTSTIDLWLGNENTPSSGAVFFDEVSGVQLSQNAYYENINHRIKNGDNFKTTSIDDRNIIDTSSINFDFEKDNTGAVNTMVDWKIENQNEKGHARVIDMNEGNFEHVTSLTYPGTDFSKNNTKSMVLWANEGYVSVVSQPVDIKAFGLYKITVRAKTADLTAGTFLVKARETSKIKDEFAYLDSYTPCSKDSTAISGKGSNKFINEYSEMIFYVQGHSKYNSQIELVLSLGSDSNLAKGGVAIDNIVVERVGSDDFKTDGNYLELKTATAYEGTIKNGNFNSAANLDKNTSSLFKPADWTLSQSSANVTKQAGILNIYQPYFSAGGFEFANPGDALDGTTTDVENVFMMYNSNLDYQSATSSTFSISASTYYNLTFRYKTMGEGSKINVKVVDENGIVLRYDKGLSSDNWSTYNCLINAGEASNSLKLVLELGNSDEKAAGHAFFDRVELNSSSKETFNASEGNKIDLSGFMLSLDPNGSINNAISSSNAFTGKVEIGSIGAANGGIVKGKGNTNFEYIDKEGNICPIDDGTLDNNVLVVSTNTPSTYSLSSNFNLSTEKDKYYKLKFRLLTSFPDAANAKKDAKYGVKIGLNGFDFIENLKSNNGWQEYTILFKATETKDAKFSFSLVSDSMATTGCAYVTDISWESSEENLYTGASEKEEFGKTLFTSKTAASTNDDTNNDDSNNGSNKDSQTTDNTMWLLIPSLITAVALIIAIVGFCMRHVKFKKTDKKRKEGYDRNSTASNITTNQAKDVQKAEIEKVDAQIAELENKISELDAENKEVSEKAREAGRVTGEVEKEFRTFAAKRAKIQKQIEELGEHKAMLASPDHLLSIEKKIVALNKSKAKVPKSKDDKAKTKKK